MESKAYQTKGLLSARQHGCLSARNGAHSYVDGLLIAPVSMSSIGMRSEWGMGRLASPAMQSITGSIHKFSGRFLRLQNLPVARN
jgi:hypothetical protein